MFWKPKTRTEWALVIGIGLCTLAWIIHDKWNLNEDHLGFERPVRLPDDVIIVLLWLIYGYLRVQVRKPPPDV